MVEQARTLWLTGLSGAGKSTLAQGLAERFVADGVPHFVLDGDVVRTGLCRDLGFSEADRSENIRRVAEVARLMNLAGLNVICALISPLEADRSRARQIVGPQQFLEVHVATPLARCEERDPKGLYRKARGGQLAGMTGVDSPYEEPVAPALRLDTSGQSLQQCLDRLLALWSGR